jgi:hypothetical protein
MQGGTKVGTTDNDKMKLEQVGFTFTLSRTVYALPHFHVHVKGPNFEGVEDAIVFDVDDDDHHKAEERAVALASEKYAASDTMNTVREPNS